MKPRIMASSTVCRIDFVSPDYHDNLALLLEEVAAYLRANRPWVWDIVIHDETHFPSDAPDGVTSYRAELYCEPE
jgi:predicted DNA-binding transcriptional regulator AlpA